MHNWRRIALFILVLVTLGAPGVASAQTPSDEDDIEQEIEDDGSYVPTEENVDEDPDAIVETPAPTPKPEDEISTSTPPPTQAEQAEPEVEDGRPKKIFDWDKHRGESEVKHPFAEKGLIRINKDRTYFYKVGESEQKQAASLHIGMYDPVNLENPDAENEETASFASNYDQSSNPAVIFEYEWQMWRNPLGKFGLRVGTGLFVAQGHGHFASGSAVGKDQDVPLENFTFTMLPNTVGIVYRAHIWDKQLFVPYAEGGGVAYTFGEFRDDSVGPKFGGALAAYGAGGVAINLTYFDAMSRIQLDREYGINACYLTLEYRRFQAITTRFDFSTDYFNGGFLMEY